MTDRPGERAEKSRSNRFWGLMAGFMLLGGMIGAALVVMEKSEGALPAALAIGIALVVTTAIGGGTWYFLRSVDEVERLDNYVAGTVALNFYLIVYANWYFLWKGAVVPEPRHETLFIATMIVMAAAYFWKKLRP
ncbi:hypothetical protein P6144_18460 [Sphingomonas sp. HITSZ_GF]|uniref:hypothetical protein n=1 Tax=Sphingomonas sp. HITSZ_GF TaxID=3037247 RepID=UPI00240E5CC7|nr:hypothetical protein [Sphingomonas sp. HITSZ_GF]MDG2535651.1 hypothetical protein [Sphingomonas sp. HITSZ_GF]